MGWGISENATPKEKIKSEMADYLHGLNATGAINIRTYDEAFDFSMRLLDKMYERGQIDEKYHVLDNNKNTPYKDKFVGVKIYGYCDGHFGRDSYGKRIIIASGMEWIVTQDKYGEHELATFDNPSEMQERIQKWSIKEKENEI